MIFLSYARADGPLVDELYEHLTREGVDVWLDRRRLSAGESWLASIAAAIESAERVIVVASQYSARSGHVRWEHQHAVAAERMVHVVRIDDGDPRPLGAPTETVHDFRIDPLDPAPWLALARGQGVPPSGLEASPRVHPGYVRASARAAWPLVFWLLASAGAFSIANLFYDEITGEQIANPALWAVYLPGALLLWAFQWEFRRIHLLRRRRLRSNRNNALPRAQTWATVGGAVVIVALYWWAVLLALLVDGAVSKYRKGEVRVFGRRFGRGPKDPAHPPESLLKRLANWVAARVRSSTSDYHNAKIAAWLPAFVERRAHRVAAVDESALRLRQTLAAAPAPGTARAPALVFADPDVPAAERLAADLRTPAVELAPLSRIHDFDEDVAGKHDGVIFVLSRYSHRALAALSEHQALVVVAFGPTRIPEAIAHRQLLDLTNREVASVAEAVDETLATGRHSELSTTADRRSSFLGVPAGVRSFLFSYVVMMVFLGALLWNDVLEGPELAAIALPVAVLMWSWLWIVLTRRAPLSLGLVATAIIVGVLGVAIGRHARSLDAFLLLVVPGLWILHQRDAMRKGERPVDMWAPRVHLGAISVAGMAIIGVVGLAAAWVEWP